MNRPLLVLALFTAAAATLVAQEASQSSPYSGVSNPPPDTTIVADDGSSAQTATPAKPAAGHPMTAPATPAQPAAAAAQPAPALPPSQTASSGLVTGTDDGIVQVAPSEPASVQPALQARADGYDPDGDIVHPAPLPPGVLGEGTRIRVRLIGDLSSGLAEKGQEFRSRVSADVEQNGEILIPAGSEIDGTVAEVSAGHFGGRGSLLLRPRSVTLPNGTRYQLSAVVSQTPMSRTHVGAEGVISPNDNLKRDGIEYGGGVGAGVVAGAYLGGPVGALAGGLVGAALVTTHLLVSHPQAHIDAGDVLVLTLTQNMRLESVTHTGE